MRLPGPGQRPQAHHGRRSSGPHTSGATGVTSTSHSSRTGGRPSSLAEGEELPPLLHTNRDLTHPARLSSAGRHERMHKDLKAERPSRPPRTDPLSSFRFNTFRADFNEIRPHEAHGQKPPASVYQPSTRPLPSKLLTPDYPAHFETRKVSTNGGIRWHSAWVNVSHLLGSEYIGLEEVADDVWAVYFGPVSLGWLHVRKACHPRSRWLLVP